MATVETPSPAGFHGEETIHGDAPFAHAFPQLIPPVNVLRIFSSTYYLPTTAFYLTLFLLLTMPNPGAFHGLRLEFLVAEQAGFAAAVANGTKEEFMKDLLRRYFKRFPIELPHNEDPSEEHLAAVDDNAPDPEPEAPNPMDYAESEAQYNAALAAFEGRNAVIVARSSQIMRWLTYRHNKATSFNNVPVKQSDCNDPMFIFMCRLLGKSSKKPRKPIAYNLWSQHNKSVVQAALALKTAESSQRPSSGKGKKRHDVGEDVKIKKELFEKQPAAVQEKYKGMADKQLELMMAEWTFNLTRPASKDPEARQVCIDGITSFMQPVLDLIVEATGMKAMLLVGGPEPAAHGMSILGIHSGHTKGPVKQNFAEAESKRFKEQVVPAFSAFLHKCYSAEDIKECALTVEATPLLSIVDPKSVTYFPLSGSTPDSSGPKPTQASQSSQETSTSQVAAADSSQQSGTQVREKKKQKQKKSSDEPSPEEMEEQQEDRRTGGCYDYLYDTDSYLDSSPPPRQSSPPFADSASIAPVHSSPQPSSPNQVALQAGQGTQPRNHLFGPPGRRRKEAATLATPPSAPNFNSQSPATAPDTSNHPAAQGTISCGAAGVTSSSPPQGSQANELLEEGGAVHAQVGDGSGEGSTKPAESGRKRRAEESETEPRRKRRSGEKGSHSGDSGQKDTQADGRHRRPKKIRSGKENIAPEKSSKKRKRDEGKSESQNPRKRSSDHEEPGRKKKRGSDEQRMDRSSLTAISTPATPSATPVSAPAAPSTTSGSAPAAPSATPVSAPAEPSTTSVSAPAAPLTTSVSAPAAPSMPSISTSAAPLTTSVSAPAAPSSSSALNPPAAPSMPSISTSAAPLTTSVSAPAAPSSSSASAPAAPPTASISAPAAPPTASISAPAAPPTASISAPATPSTTSISTPAGPSPMSASPPAVLSTTTVSPPAALLTTTVSPPAASSTTSEPTPAALSVLAPAAMSTPAPAAMSTPAPAAMTTPAPAAMSAPTLAAPSSTSSMPAAAPPSFRSCPSLPSASWASLPELPGMPCNGVRLTYQLALGGRSWGPKWEALLAAWLEFEASYEFQGGDSSKLGSTHRPSIIGDWIRRHRLATWRPSFDPFEFEERFWMWWKSLQPAWRTIDQEAPSRLVEGGWEVLDKAGTNGIASVVAALFFWGHCLGAGRESTQTSWIHAVEDASWVLQQLCAHRASQLLSRVPAPSVVAAAAVPAPYVGTAAVYLPYVVAAAAVYPPYVVAAAVVSPPSVIAITAAIPPPYFIAVNAAILFPTLSLCILPAAGNLYVLLTILAPALLPFVTVLY
ncbi:hypothetical protein CVT26_002550 [Gymnopilus dilepis]|uniref:Uncharacterized protein n=1 Tax=Gymnopilus dilepis TaxID=231916 RepID=A0A409Y3P1_9AGAR|nr:hypothetical protein CVT26_002550 [Gymnopilus dilepis]